MATQSDGTTQHFRNLKVTTQQPDMKKQRKKCFTGCWTCRSRRVKCDEGSPSCQRCRQIGITCEGYGVRLSWVQYDPKDIAKDGDDHSLLDNSDQPQTRGSRRLLASHTASALLRSPELDATLDTIDAWHPRSSSQLAIGAFGVFAPDSSAVALPRPVDKSERQSLRQRFTAEISINSPSSRSGTFPIDTDAPVCNDILVETTRSLDGIQESSVHIVQQPTSDALHERHVRIRHLDALTMPSIQKRLIHHWITFTSRKLVLIDEPHNPCRTMMLPMALKGLTSHLEASNADVAIFHAVCASAAYNLYELGGRTKEQDRVIALYHDDAAVHHLRHNLARADQHRDQSFAMAIMACIAVEAVSGTTQRWRTHVSGGLAYLLQLEEQSLDEATLAPFRQHMVKMAILCGIPVPPHLKHFLNDESGASDGLEYTFPYYGVSRTFLRAQDNINDLVASLRAVETAEEENKLDSFELKMYLDFPGLPNHGARSTAAGSTHNTLIHHTSKAFYYAGLVYFQRSARSVPLASVQELVELGVHELESLDRVGEGALGCLMLWPVLILGAECDTSAVQGRIKGWFQSQRRLGFRNLVVLEDLIAEVWITREGHGANKDDVDWQKVITQPQFDVFRL